MLSRVESAKKGRGDSNSGKFLNEIDALSKALYLDNNPSRRFVSAATSRSKSLAKTHLPDTKLKQKSGFGVEDVSEDKKSIWNWRPLKAFSRSRRFDCSFYLQVHSIKGLPSSMSGASLQVHWKRRDGELITSPAKIFQGVAKFEGKLVHDCQVYGSRNGPHHSAKYEAKHFLLYPVVLASPELDLGKHRIDLTRLLPLTLEELEGEKSSGKWATSYKLSGKAAGAIMNVSFGYSVIGDNAGVPKSDKSVTRLQNNLKQGDGKSKMRRSGSLNLHSRILSPSIENIKDLHGVLPTSNSELASSVITLYQKFDEEKVEGPVDLNPELDTLTNHIEPVKPNTCPLMDSSIDNVENGRDDKEFSIAEQGVELSSKTEEKSDEVSSKDADASVVESADVPPPSVETNSGTQEAYDDQHMVNDDDLRRNDPWSKESLMKVLESALKEVTNFEIGSLDSLDDEENGTYAQPDNLLNKNGKPLNPDDVTESEFLVMMGLENSPIHFSSESESESPRERLLRQFEKDTLASGSSLFGFETDYGDLGEYVHNDSTGSDWEILAESFGLPAADEQHVATEEGNNKRRAKILEDLESEALMREWGLNEEAFQYSPPKGGFGSPIDLMPEEVNELPPLGEGLGPFLQTKSGGFVRSMNPSLFKNAKSGGNLVMQVSSPVVVPAEMGSGVMEILQGLASVGIEKLSMQASKLMPLEDITGKTMQRVAWEAVPALEEPERQCLSEHEYKTGQGASNEQKREKERLSKPRKNKSSSRSSSSELVSEYVSLEDLAPLAMDKMEALSIEGLRIQSGMSGDEAPPNISSKSIGEISALQGKGSNMNGSLGLEGAAGLQLLDIKGSGEDVDGLMGLSLTLDEWMRLDSGEIGDEDEISERTTKVLAAHHANSMNTIRGQKRRGKRKCGLLGNNFTVALMVQLRDPLRDYEPVGAPMLSLIQVERVFVPPKPKIYCTVSVARSCGEDNEPDPIVEEMKETRESLPEEEAIPKFKITEVHVAGLKTEPHPQPSKKKLWGSSNQQQSGSRWLVANGMGKSNKNPFMKSKAVSKSSTTKVQSGESLWSISSRILGNGVKLKELAALDPHIRNPNVIFPDETIRLC